MAQYTETVLVRMTPEQAARLDEVQAMRSPLSTRAAAVRRLIDSLDDDDIAAVAEAAAAPPATRLHPDDVAALQARTEAYDGLAGQVRAVGHFLNTITRLGHRIATYGSAEAIPVEAVESVRRELISVDRQMQALRAQDRADDMRLAG